jgi:hypothetical protein
MWHAHRTGFTGRLYPQVNFSRFGKFHISYHGALVLLGTDAALEPIMA